MPARGIPVQGKGYKSGSHYAICDRCGFQFRAEKLRQTWEGWWVCVPDCWEARHEQDFLRVKQEKITADQPLRNEDLSNLIDPSFAHEKSAVAGVAVAGLAVAGTPDLDTEKIAFIIPTGTFDNTL